MIGSRGEERDVIVGCPGCGLRLPGLRDDAPKPQVNASTECQSLCHELWLYTLSHGDAFFIHQSVWMAWEREHPAVRTLIDQYEKR